MHVNLKRLSQPSVNPSRGHSHNRKRFWSIALLVARRSTLRQVGLLPPVALKVSHFFLFGKDGRYPVESAAQSNPGKPRGYDVR